MLRRLIHTKTFWTAAAVILTAAEQVATGKATVIQALQVAVPALLAILLRDGVAKAEKAAAGKPGM